MVEGVGLENRYTLRVSGVQIPFSPPFSMIGLIILLPLLLRVVMIIRIEREDKNVFPCRICRYIFSFVCKHLFSVQKVYRVE